jgi:hypothetical protein
MAWTGSVAHNAQSPLFRIACTPSKDRARRARVLGIVLTPHQFVRGPCLPFLHSLEPASARDRDRGETTSESQFNNCREGFKVAYPTGPSRMPGRVVHARGEADHARMASSSPRRDIS